MGELRELNELGKSVLAVAVGYNRKLFHRTINHYLSGIRDTVDGHLMEDTENWMLNYLLDGFERELDEMFYKNQDKPEKYYEYTGEKLGGDRLFMKELEQKEKE